MAETTKVYAVFEQYDDYFKYEDSRYYDTILPQFVFTTYDAALKKCIELADRVRPEHKTNYTYHVVELTVTEG